MGVNVDTIFVFDLLKALVRLEDCYECGYLDMVYKLAYILTDKENYVFQGGIELAGLQHRLAEHYGSFTQSQKILALLILSVTMTKRSCDMLIDFAVQIAKGLDY